MVASNLLLIGCGGAVQRKGNVSNAAIYQMTNQCILPNGVQDHSLQGHWQTSPTSVMPLKISLQAASQFQTSEKNAIAAAAQSWNQFFKTSKGSPVFLEAISTSTLNEISPDCTVSDTGQGIVLYKRGTWAKKGSALIGVTSYCQRRVSCDSSSSIKSCLPLMYHAMLELNYQDYFVASSALHPDLQSVVLHEMGHVLGLDHSCGSLRTGLSNATCPTDGTNDPNFIFPSIMYPSWSDGDVKRTLTTNDMGRANCLY